LKNFLSDSYGQALAEFVKLKDLAEPVKVLENLPKSSIIVLIAAKKVVEQASVFNFEAVYTKYKVF
jgi:Origin recognition complex (ORC) subunit 4 C-terminus